MIATHRRNDEDTPSGVLGKLRQRSRVVQETRSAFQVAMKQKFISAVERLSGREVLLFTSNHHVGPDLEVEVFMLKPVPGSAVKACAGDELTA